MLSEANFLILDEPTNHLDITSKEILEQALQNYTGTILYVSHDRYFINRTATRILELSGQNLTNYIGNYDYYWNKKNELSTRIPAGSSDQIKESLTDSQQKPAEAISEVKQNWKAQKEAQARVRKRQNDLKKTEEEIQQLENRDSAIDELLQQEEIYTNTAKLMELNQEKEAVRVRLENLYEQWESLAEIE